MRFFRNLFIGYRAFYKAFRFIIEHKMYWYVGIPANFNVGYLSNGTSDSVAHSHHKR